MNYTAKISLTIAIVAIIAGGVWYAQKGAPEAPPADGGTDVVVDSSGDSLGGDEVDMSGDENIEVIEAEKIDYQSNDWMIYENTRFRYRIVLPSDFKNYSEYDGSEQEFGPDHYGFNAGNGSIAVVATGGDRFVSYQGKDSVTDNWESGPDIELYKIGSNLYYRTLPFREQKYFTTANEKYIIGFEFINFDDNDELKAKILNSFEFIN